MLSAELATQPVAFDRLLALRRSDALLWYVRALDHLVRCDAKAAVTDFSSGGEPPATTEFAYVYAGALLLAGDEAGYAGYVSSQAKLHGDTNVPFTLYVLTRMAMLAERPPAPPARILDWASRAVKEEPGVAWFAHAQGMAAFRAGDMETARGAIEESERLPWNVARALNQIALSLIDLREGHTETARSRYDRPSESLAERTFSLRSVAFAFGNGHPLDWLEFQVLRPQIEGPLYDRDFPTDVFTH